MAADHQACHDVEGSVGSVRVIIRRSCHNDAATPAISVVSLQCAISVHSCPLDDVGEDVVDSVGGPLSVELYQRFWRLQNVLQVGAGPVGFGWS